VFVAAAGNDSRAACMYPANDVNVISVGSVDSVHQRTSYSNYGPCIDQRFIDDSEEQAAEIIRNMVINGGNVDASRYLLEQTIKSAYRRASFFTSWLCSWRRRSSTRLWNPADMATVSGVFLTSFGTARDLPARIQASTSYVRFPECVPPRHSAPTFLHLVRSCRAVRSGQYGHR
jgi:hypothetical protein